MNLTDNSCNKDQLVDGETLLQKLFAKPCRPSLRWLRTMQMEGKLPSHKIGRLVFFDPQEVRAVIFAKKDGAQ